MIVHVVVRPGVSPSDRAGIEGIVIEALGAGAESVGGGTVLDGERNLVESDFDVQVPDGGDRAELKAAVRTALERIEFAKPSAFTVDIFDDEEEDEDDVPTVN